MSLFIIYDIDTIFMPLLQLNSLLTLSYVNKYYHNLTKSYLAKYKLFFISLKDRPILYANNRSEKTLLNAVAYGDIDVFSYVYSKLDNDISCHQRLLRVACSWSHLHIAKWIIKNAGNKVDIHDDNDIIFRNACWYDRLDIAKYVYGLSYVNIRACFDEAFRYACLFNNNDIALWLISIQPNIYSIKYVKNSMIPCIN